MKKRSRIIIISLVVVVLITAILGFLIFNNNTYNTFTTTISENRWLNDHRDELLDITVFTNVPVFSAEGEGIAFDFLDSFKEAINLELNVTSHPVFDAPEINGFRVLRPYEELTSNDHLFYQDNYVLISDSNHKILNVNSITGRIGVLEDEEEEIATYLGAGVTLVTAENIASLMEMFGEDVDYIMLPHNLYINEILDLDNYYVNYNFSNFSLKYVFTVDPEEEKLASIVRKFFRFYERRYLDDSVKEWQLSTFYNSLGIPDVTRAEFLTRSFEFAYINELPYGDRVAGDDIGVINNFLSRVASFADLNINFQRVSDLDDVEVGTIYYEHENRELAEDAMITSAILNHHYVVLTNDGSNFIVDNIRALNNRDIIVQNNPILVEYLEENTTANITAYNTINRVISNTRNDDIIIVDKLVYTHEKSGRLSDMGISYNISLEGLSGFVVYDETLRQLINFFILTNNTDVVNSENINYLISNPMKQSIYNTLARYILVLVVALIIVLIVAVYTFRKKTAQLKVQKDEKLRYIDQMTSLKNRNYLNDNVEAWDDNKIYPQAVMVVDLNNLKFINDNYGHEAGDEVIKKAASILINSQKENTDILRIDGNEFLIYLVGYPEKEIVSYMRKLFKELKALPYDFGGAVGYSMITDDIKTIDDAINEATLDMRVNKKTSQKN